MRHLSKPRPLLAAFALAASICTVSAPADAAPAVPSTFFAYTAPLMAPLGDTAPHVPLALASLLCAAAVTAAAFLPARRIVAPVAPAPAAPAAPVAVGPIFCPLTKRWRDPVSRRFVKAPAV